MENNLAIIPVLSKVDLPYADVAGVTEQMVNAFGVDEKEIIQCSAKSGLGISDVLSAIIERIPPPKGKTIGEANTSSRAFLFDTWYDIHRGVICLLKVEDGEISKGDVICAYHSGGVFDVSEVGLLTPEKHPGLTDILRAGQVGYIVAGIKSTKDVRLGETFFIAKKGGWKLPENKKRANLEEERGKIQPLPGFKPAKSMVFAGLFPGGENDFEELSLAMNKLTLNDASVSFTKETSMALGMGFRCGFLGVLHMDVFTQRLQQEFGCSVITTAPTVPYEATMIETDEITDQQLQLLIDSPKAFPDPVAVDTFYEPMVRVSLITPQQYVGDLTQLCVNYRGELEDVKFVSADRAIMRYKIPLGEVIIDFYQQVKSVSSGFASLDYEELPVQEAEIVKLDIKINGEAVDALSTICHSSKAVTLGKRLALKLKESIDRQNFEIIIQAFQGGKIVARERVAPFRKDVLVKSGKMVGGGDITRKKKLLEKQKEGKKRMKSVGSVELNDDTFLSVMKAHSSTD